MQAHHLSQAELICFLDGEIPAEESARMNAHLEDCTACQIALQEIHQIDAELRLTDISPNLQIQDDDEARISLAARLEEARGTDSILWRDRVRSFAGARIPLETLVGATAVVGAAVLFLYIPRLHPSAAEMVTSLPNHALTPGMVRPVNVDAVCSAGDDDLDPEVPSSTQKAVFTEYGISVDRSAKDFQVDYLISPQLGGTADVRNLWPQSYNDSTWNARAKDALERHLYQLVCEKKINLVDAQREIATNWIAAYQKYFRTNKPA